MQAEHDTSPKTTHIGFEVRDNTIICGANGGNVSGYEGDTIVWTSADPDAEWLLQFVPLGLENEGAAPLNDLSEWPFTKTGPSNGIVVATREFQGTLREFRHPDHRQPVAFKYTLTIGKLRLDPIVIVVSKP
jgi:hypothetical protein